jgi:hypothetical protein
MGGRRPLGQLLQFPTNGRALNQLSKLPGPVSSI